MTASSEWNLRCPDCGGTDAIDIAATLVGPRLPGRHRRHALAQRRP